MVTRVRSGAVDGIDGYGVTVEVDAARGLPLFQIVGLPNAAVRESRERVLAALRNSGFGFPPGRVTVNLAPADVRKEGASFDLAIALGIIAAQEGSDGDGRRSALFLGELSLCGELRPVRGLLAIVLAAAAHGERRFVVPAGQAAEAALVGGVEVIGASRLDEVVAWWKHGISPPEQVPVARGHPAVDAREERAEAAAFQGLVGQRDAQYAAIIAAAGRHNLLLVGPPGTGKTRLARSLRGLLPDLGPTEALEATRIHSAAGILRGSRLLRRRPLRAPHHTITRAGLIGGSVPLRPGEVTLAHHGVLFLDELSEFAPAVLDALREPLEEGRVCLARGPDARSFPAAFQFVAAANPCRCGYLGSRRRACRCSPAAIAQHRGRLSGPLLDRIDLFVEMAEPPVPLQAAGAPSGGDPLAPAGAPSSVESLGAWQRARARVAAARLRLGDRLPAGEERCRSPWAFVRAAGLDAGATSLLEEARDRLGLSVRGVMRCARVARTIAALSASEVTTRAHVADALRFRLESLPGWGVDEGAPAPPAEG